MIMHQAFVANYIANSQDVLEIEAGLLVPYDCFAQGTAKRH